MLSAETAAGAYPQLAVAAMTRIIMEIERRPLPHVDLRGAADVEGHVATEDAIAAATTAAAKSLGAPLVVVFTKSGFSARIIASHRPGVPILVLTDSERTYRQLALVWGVIPELVPRSAHYEEMFEHARAVDRAARAGQARRSRARDGRRSLRRAGNDQSAPRRGGVKLTFLGTGTSFGVPQIGCSCEVCQIERSARQAHAKRRARGDGCRQAHPHRHAARAPAAADRGARRPRGCDSVHARACGSHSRDRRCARALRADEVARSPCTGRRRPCARSSSASPTSSMSACVRFRAPRSPRASSRRSSPACRWRCGRDGAADRGAARTDHGVRLSHWPARLHHRCEAPPRAGDRRAPGREGAGAQRAVLEAASHAHERSGGDRDGARWWERSARISRI